MNYCLRETLKYSRSGTAGELVNQLLLWQTCGTTVPLSKGEEMYLVTITL